MELILQIASGLTIIVIVAVTVGLLLLLRTALPKRRPRIRMPLIGASISAVLLLACLIRSTSFISPLDLPPGAKDVRIDCALPFNPAIDDNLRFQVSPKEFRTWMETLCKMPWESIRTNSRARFEAVVDGRWVTPAIGHTGRSRLGEDFEPPWSISGVAPWLNPRGLRNGYWMRPPVGGDLIYDSDSEQVYYHYWN